MSGHASVNSTPNQLTYQELCPKGWRVYRSDKEQFESFNTKVLLHRGQMVAHFLHIWR